MFRLCDRTRRVVCRAAFVGLCVLPTVGVTAWGLWRQCPGHTRSQARWLTRRLGLRVTCRRVEHLAPRRTRWVGLQLADPETGRQVLACASVEATVMDGSDDAAALDLVVHRPRLHRAGLRALGALLRRTMRRRTAGRSIDLTVRAEELLLADGGGDPGGALRVTACQGTLRSRPAGAQAGLRFQLADRPATEPGQVEVIRNRQSDPPSTAVKIDTGAGALPCRLLAVGLPPLGRLGPKAQFRGKLWAGETPGGWSGELSGQLAGVETARLVDDHFNHSLRTQAQVTIEAARFHHGRLQQAAGTLTTGPGTISRGLLGAAVTQLELVQKGEGRVRGEGRGARANPASPLPPAAGPGVRAGDRLISFQQLGVAWSIGPQGLWLAGRCPGAGPGTIMIDRRRRLLGEPVAQPQPVAALVRTLAPPGREQVPAGSEAGWLLRRLPATPEGRARVAGR